MKKMTTKGNIIEIEKNGTVVGTEMKIVAVRQERKLRVVGSDNIVMGWVEFETHADCSEVERYINTPQEIVKDLTKNEELERLFALLKKANECEDVIGADAIRNKLSALTLTK